MNGSAAALLAVAAIAGPRGVYRSPLSTQGQLEPAEIEALGQRVDTQISGTDFELSAIADEAAFSLEMSVDATQADQHIELTVTDLADGTAVVEVSRTCELCGRDELLDAVSDVAATGLRKLDSYASVSTTLTVDSEPPGAQVRVDGEALGRTPIELEVAPGPHTLELSADDHEPLSEAIEVRRGTSERVRLYLSPSPSDVEVQPQPRRGRVIAGATLIGGGTVALATGITLLVLHGRPVTSACSGDDVDLDGDCHFLHDTRLGGAIGASVGGAALIAGSVLLILEFRRKRTSSLAVAPTGNGVLLRGRF